MLDSFDVYSRPLPDRRHSGDHVRFRPPMSRNTSSTSIKSEPGLSTSPSHGDLRAARSANNSRSGSKSPSGLGWFFGKSKPDKPDKPEKAQKSDKPKKERRGRDPIVQAARHAAAVRARKAAEQNNMNATNGSCSVPRVVGTQKSHRVSAEEQAMRRPHSGPPTLAPVKDRVDSMGVLTRIISGDEADEPDERQRMREEYKQNKYFDLDMLQVVERGLGSINSSGTTTPEDRELIQSERSSPERTNPSPGPLPSVAEHPVSPQQYRPRPLRRNTPIGLRWKKDEHGVWKR
ncbi:hypothetical protein A1O1_06080 [Capronia coronata CBS 617.96]|uniref:Uncharacterized protein n=1 Tax=Capronia coronata CBS 617.96 TaxID=1182541 RepID=W9XYS5_9EURO|nr:uncharacterized protein A1O1_06080 [Capronia coronata CBS 617.96]EXJ85712.1 hypothetical protein A1O1_06080 [Capronia coronata CBS 617.96]